MTQEPSPDDTSLSLSRSRKWMESFKSFAEGILERDDTEEALQSLLELATNASDADGALLFLESIGSTLLCEYAHCCGPDDSSLSTEAIGLKFEVSTPNMDLLQSGQAVISNSHANSPRWIKTVDLQGPLMMVPMMIGGHLQGVLVLIRNSGGNSFSPADAVHAVAFALQGAVAVDLIESKQARSQVELVEERERIGRDLHDLAIQGLFATGIKLRGLQQKLSDGVGRPEIERDLAEALDSLDGSVHQIRSIVYRLKDEEAASGLVDRLRREASNSRAPLGFAPTLIIEVDSDTVTLSGSTTQSTPQSLLERDMASRADAAAADVSDDVVAIVREALANVAKHAKATSVSVSVAIHGSGPVGEIIITIVDDGEGLDPSISRESGLANMQRRAVLRGGSFAMGSGPRGRGTALVWRAPLQ